MAALGGIATRSIHQLCDNHHMSLETITLRSHPHTGNISFPSNSVHRKEKDQKKKKREIPVTFFDKKGKYKNRRLERHLNTQIPGQGNTAFILFCITKERLRHIQLYRHTDLLGQASERMIFHPGHFHFSRVSKDTSVSNRITTNQPDTQKCRRQQSQSVVHNFQSKRGLYIYIYILPIVVPTDLDR